MPNYRRVYVPGAWYFFTVVTHNRQRILTTSTGLEALSLAVSETRSKHPFDSIAWVILPDHLHYVWRLPDGDSDFSTRWNLIKGRFTRSYTRVQGNRTVNRSASRARHREQAVWQRRFWEHCIRDEEDLRRHINYIHYNPVKHGYVQEPLQWQHTSGHRLEFKDALANVDQELVRVELDGAE